MKLLKVFILSSVLLLAFGMAVAREIEETDVEETGELIIMPEGTVDIEEIIALDEDVTAEDLEIKEPRLLPDNPFYFLKNWGREIQSIFTFNAVKKAELRERFANEKLIELKKVAEKTQNRKRIEKATRNYQNEVDTVNRATEQIRQRAEENEEVGKFLDKFVQQQTLHQRILQKLESQVPTEVFAKISQARENHLEKFGEVMTRLEDKANIQERLENNMRQVKGSEFKEFKNLEVLEGLKEKIPEEAKEAVQGVMENSLTRLKEQVQEMSAEKLEKFQTYTERISGTKERQIQVLENLKVELKATPQLQQKLNETRNRVMETIRVQERECPEIEKPAENYCGDGRIVVRKDDAGCVIGFSCVQAEQQSSACITLWDPVCGKNGRTYSNKCYAEQAGVGIAYRGQCKKTECQQDSDCAQSRCIGAQTKCIDGECVVPRCEIKTQIQTQTQTQIQTQTQNELKKGQ